MKILPSTNYYKKVSYTIGNYQYAPNFCGKKLLAKPIIDILISVKSLKGCDNLLKNLDNAGYSVRYDNAEKGEYLVRKGPEDNRTHYIHVVEDKTDRCTEMIIFRDYLINNPEYIEQYQVLKEELASKYKNERKMYTASKNEFIKMVLDKARETI